jgi:DNA-binding NarL/FixJ family response regulator
MVCFDCIGWKYDSCRVCRAILKSRLAEILQGNISEELKAFINNKNEQIKQLIKEISIKNQELENLKAKIILSEDNACRSGRKSLPEDIQRQIKELRQQGKTVREVSEYLSVSVGTVSKYSRPGRA